EESDGEVGRMDRQYRIKTLPWRARTLTDWLHSLDQLPPETAQKPNSRAARHRLPSRIQSENHTPPHHLPTSFYDREWLESQSNSSRAALKITNDKLELPDLAPLILVLHPKVFPELKEYDVEPDDILKFAATYLTGLKRKYNKAIEETSLVVTS
ncbi:3285_t:CDS:2, partial [Acaulospora colombiana]